MKYKTYREIPVSERLPEEELIYTVVDVDLNMFQAVYDKEFGFNSEFEDCSGITHWLEPYEAMNIKEISSEIHQNNVAKGFWEEKETKNVGEVLMLVVSELSEALEAHRKNKFSEPFERFNWFDDWSEERSSDRINFQDYIKDSFEDEIADAVIRLFDLAEGFRIDLEKHIRMKLNYNKTRPYKHGKKY